MKDKQRERDGEDKEARVNAHGVDNERGDTHGGCSDKERETPRLATGGQGVRLGFRFGGLGRGEGVDPGDSSTGKSAADLLADFRAGFGKVDAENRVPLTVTGDGAGYVADYATEHIRERPGFRLDVATVDDECAARERAVRFDVIAREQHGREQGRLALRRTLGRFVETQIGEPVRRCFEGQG